MLCFKKRGDNAAIGNVCYEVRNVGSAEIVKLFTLSIISYSRSVETLLVQQHLVS